MKYEKYKRKAEIINKILNKVYQLRFVLIAVSSTAVVSTLSYEGIRGIVKIEDPQKTTFVYGEEFSFTSSAILENSFIQYSKKGSNNWVSNAPIYPGEYQVRGISKNGYGAQTKSKPVDFTIKKRDANVYVNQSQILYGNLPTINANLFGTDRLDSTYNVVYENPYTNSTTVAPEVNSIKVLDASGKDITFCYNLTPINKNIEVLPRKLTVYFDDFSKIYDGVSYQYEDGHISEDTPLLPGDTLTFNETEPELPESGIYQDFEYSKPVTIKRDNQEINCLYDITYVKGKLSVGRIDMEVTSPFYDSTYNGKTLKENGVFGDVQIVSEKMLSNHYVKVIYDHEEEFKDSYITTKDGFTNSFSVKVYENVDGTEVDVSNFYSITTKFNKVKVGKAPLTITTQTNEKIYDAEAIERDKYTFTGELKGKDELVVNTDLLPLLTNPISNETNNANLSELIKVMNGENDATSYYDISVVPGTLTILKRPIEIKMIGFEKEYDGESSLLDAFEINPNKTDELVGDESKFKVSLKEAHYAEKCGEYSSCDVDNFKISLNDVDVTSCFDITFTESTSKIKQREIHPTLYFVNESTEEVDHLTYDGQEHEIFVKFEDGELLDTHKATFDESKTKQKLFSENGFGLESLGLDIVDKDSGDTFLDQYKIVDSNTVYIDKKDLEITLPEIHVVYDGSKHKIEFEEQTLETGDIVSSETVGEIQNAGDTFEFKKEFITVENADCYEITYKENKESTISDVSKKEITINYSSYQGEYDGKNHEITANCEDLPEGFKLSKTSWNVKNAKSYAQTDFPVSVEDLSGNDQSKNFDIKYNFKKVEISKFKFEVTFNAPATTPVFNAQEYTFDDIIISRSDQFPEGEKPVINNVLTATKAGVYNWDDLDINVVVKNSDNSELLGWENNYDITINHWEKVEIAKKKLFVTFAPFSPVFNTDTIWEAFKPLYDEGVKNGSNQMVKLNDGFNDVTNDYLDTKKTHIEVTAKTKANNDFVENYELFTDYFDVSMKNPNTADIQNNFDLDFGSEQKFKSTPFNIVISVSKFKSTYNRGDGVESQRAGLGRNDSSNNGILSIRKSTEDEKKFFNTTDGYYINDMIAGSFYEFEINPYLVGEYSITILKTKITVKNLNTETLSPSHYTVEFTDCENALTIEAKKLTVKEVGVEKECDGLPADEKFTVTGLCDGDDLYLYNPNSGERELIELDKTAYDLIVDMITENDQSDFSILVDGNPMLISSSNFQVWSYIGEEGEKVYTNISECYSISYLFPDGIIIDGEIPVES